MKEVGKKPGEKIAQSRIEPVSRLNKLESDPFNALFALASGATARDQRKLYE